MYTKGEWRIDTVDTTLVVRDGDLGVAAVADCNPAGCFIEPGTLKTEQEANARLIASAPLLYEALKGILLVASPENADTHMVFEKEYRGGFIVLGNRLEDAVKAIAQTEGKGE